jgi:hypothetical protein
MPYCGDEPSNSESSDQQRISKRLLGEQGDSHGGKRLRFMDNTWLEDFDTVIPLIEECQDAKEMLSVTLGVPN